jgi:hypothetical protein
MASNAVAKEASLRIAVIAEAVSAQFGGEAIRVAKAQAKLASGDIAERWHAIIEHLATVANLTKA